MEDYCFVKSLRFGLNMFPLLCWNQLYWNSTIFLINQSLTFIEHLLVPRSWFALQLGTVKESLTFKIALTSRRATEFDRCLNILEPLTMLNINSLPSELTLYLSQLSLLDFSMQASQSSVWAALSAMTENYAFLSVEYSCSHFNASVFSCKEVLWALHMEVLWAYFKVSLWSE